MNASGGAEFFEISGEFFLPSVYHCLRMATWH